MLTHILAVRLPERWPTNKMLLYLQFDSDSDTLNTLLNQGNHASGAPSVASNYIAKETLLKLAERPFSISPRLTRIYSAMTALVDKQTGPT